MKTSLPRHSRRGAAWLAVTFSLIGCSGPETNTPDQKELPPLVIPAGCNPIAADNDCLLPYPSDFFLMADAKMPSGKRVAISDAAKLRNRKGDAVDFTETHPVDGFSHHQPILAYFPSGVSTDGVIFHTDDPTKSLRPDSKVLLIEAESGQPVPVWAEVDLNTEVPAEQAFLIRPFVRLQNAKRYIVALQGLRQPSSDGKMAPLVPTPEGFSRIRDKNTAADPQLAALSTRYEKEIFPAIEKLGVMRTQLQLAWDFTVSSEESNTRDLLDIQKDLLANLRAKLPTVTIDKVSEYTKMENENIWLRIEGSIRVPLYLKSTAIGAQLFRNGSGKVAQNGEADVPFTMQLPHSANPTSATFEPVRILEYGHGFFGAREEINYGFMRGYSNEQRYATIAVDWWGMSEDDLGQVLIDALSKPGTAFDFVDRLHQAMANMIALSYVVKGPLTQVPQLKRFGKLLYDPAKLYYYGISQGAIFGVTMLSINPLIERAALSVGGGPYSLMMSRSASYEMLYNVLTGQLKDPLGVMKFMALSQSTWDRVDPITYAPHLLKNTYPQSPANRSVVFQIGVGDHSVNNLASHVMARALEIPLLTPSSAPIWGLQPVSAPADDAMVVMDWKLAKVPGIYCKVPSEAEGNDVHEGVRRSPKIKQQLDQFFRPDGAIQDTCAGLCTP